MKIVHNTVFVYLFLALPWQFPSGNASASEDSEATRATIEALFEAFNRHDVESLVDLYAEDTRLRSPGDHDFSVGKEFVRATYRSHFDNIPGVHNDVKKVVVEGNEGSVEFVASWEKPTASNPNARGHLKIASFITVENGKIVKDVTYFDQIEMAEQMSSTSSE